MRADFARVFSGKCRRGNDVLIVYVAPNGLTWSRLGLSVSKRLGNAVRRNCLRRRIREAFRLNKADLPVGLDIVCVARPGAMRPDMDLARPLRTLVREAASRLAGKDRRESLPGPENNPG